MHVIKDKNSLDEYLWFFRWKIIKKDWISSYTWMQLIGQP